MSKETAKLFEDNKYLVIKEFIDSNLAKIISNYTLLQQKFNTTLEPENSQVPFTHGRYGDPMMESLLENTTHKMEELTGYKLYPTNSYYRVYKTGDELKHHTDRPSCEISATICLGFDYSNLEKEYNWKLWVNNTANIAHMGAPEHDKGYDMQPGDAIVYKGTEIDHWREKFKGIMQSQVFFHYIDQTGPYAEIGKYDCRPGLGYPVQTRDPEKYKQLTELERQLYYSNLDNKN